MDAKIRAGLLAMLCLLGVGFAWGFWGFEEGAPFGNNGGGQNMSLEVKARFMQAAHEGDYDSAVELNDEYGIGGMMLRQSTREMFGLMADIFEAQKNGNWTGAVELREQMVGLVRETAQGLFPGNGAHEMGRGMMPHGEMNGTNECREAMQGGEAAGLMEQIREARESNDEEALAELEEELAELIPDGCMEMPGRGMPEMPKRAMGEWHRMRGMGR